MPSPPDLIDTHVRIDARTLERDGPWAAIEPVWWSATFYETLVEYEASLAPFTEPQRLVWALVWYESEVCNGGHEQFFDNSTGMVWPDALTLLRRSGATRMESILVEATQRLGGAPSRERAPRCRALRDYVEGGGSFRDLDTRFFDVPRDEDVTAVATAYIHANASAFLFDGVVKKPPPLRLPPLR